MCARPVLDTKSENLKSDTVSVSPELPAVQQEAIYCRQCHATISPEHQICPQCHVPIIRRYCSGCARLVPDHSRVCPYCETPADAKKNLLKKHFKPAVVFLSICILVALAHLYFRVAVHSRTHLAAAEKVNIPSPPQHRPAVQRPEFSEKAEQPANPDNMPGDWKLRGAQLKHGRMLGAAASQLLQKGHYSEAASLFRSAVDVFPPGTEDLSYAEALYKLGNALRLAGQPEKAIPVLRQAMRFSYYRIRVQRELRAALNQIEQGKSTE